MNKNKISKIINLASEYERLCIQKKASAFSAALFVIPMVDSAMELLFNAFEGTEIPDIIGRPNTDVITLTSIGDNSLLSNLEKYQKTEKENQYKNDIDSYIGTLQSIYNSYEFIKQNKDSAKTPEQYNRLLDQVNWFLKNSSDAMQSGNTISSMLDSMKGFGNKALEFLQEWKLNLTYESLTTNIKKLIIKLYDALSRFLPEVTKLKNNLDLIVEKNSKSQIEAKPSSTKSTATIPESSFKNLESIDSDLTWG